MSSNNTIARSSGKEKSFVIVKKWTGHLDQSIGGFDAGVYTPLLVMAGKYSKTSTSADAGSLAFDTLTGYLSFGSWRPWQASGKPDVAISNASPRRLSYEARFADETRRGINATISGSFDFASEDPFMEESSTGFKEYKLEHMRNHTSTTLIINDPLAKGERSSAVHIENDSLEGIMLIFN